VAEELFARGAFAAESYGELANGRVYKAGAMASPGKSLLVILAVLLTSACTSMQTMYFGSSYQAIANANDPLLLRHSGAPAFEQTGDLVEKSPAMWNEGYALLGYSQVVSPLLTSLAPDYSTKWGAELGAARVLMETPRPGESNLHYYLVTYWGRLDPGAFSLGATLRDLPEEVLKLVGREMNLVMVGSVTPGTPAARAGLRQGDVVAGMDGERVPDARALTERIAARRGTQAVLNVLRRGEEIDVPVALAAPAARGASRVQFPLAPWLDTPATDYSSLSAANLASANMAATMKRVEQDRKAYEERSRAQLQRDIAALDARLDARQAASQDTSRRGGSKPRPQLQQGYPTVVNSPEHYRKLMEAGSAATLRNIDGLVQMRQLFGELRPADPKMFGGK
jgi:membrane-associated protease RseP (regulator of RpoE activity)